MYLKTKSEIECSGCGACAATCSTDAIEFTDIDGFLYPEINEKKCIGCKQCEIVCERIRDIARENNTQNSYFGWHKDIKKRRESTSGGVFRALAEMYISKYPEAIVYGAVYDNEFNVVHMGAKNINDIDLMCRSKYVQSNIHAVYDEIKKNLDSGVHVMFSGTPCQVAGIRTFLKKNYENLFLVDFICHGVSNPKVFKNYIKELEEKYSSKVLSYSFRNKKNKMFKSTQKVVKIVFENGRIIENEHDTFYLSYQEMLCYRLSCNACNFASKERCSDITLGDYWGIEKDIPYLKKERKNGISLILVNSQKGYDIIEDLGNYCVIGQGPYNRALTGQMLKPTKYNTNTDKISVEERYVSKQIRRNIPKKKYIYYYFPRVYKFLTKVWSILKNEKN